MNNLFFNSENNTKNQGGGTGGGDAIFVEIVKLLTNPSISQVDLLAGIDVLNKFLGKTNDYNKNFNSNINANNNYHTLDDIHSCAAVLSDSNAEIQQIHHVTTPEMSSAPTVFNVNSPGNNITNENSQDDDYQFTRFGELFSKESNHYQNIDASYKSNYSDSISPVSSYHVAPCHAIKVNDTLNNTDRIRGIKRNNPNKSYISRPFTFIDNKTDNNDSKPSTVMLRHIPNKYTQRMLLEAIARLDIDLFRAIDFFYLPIDFRNRCNVGYAFINFTDNAAALNFFAKFHGIQLKAFHSTKVCAVSWARLQGLFNNIEFYRNSPVNGEDVINQYRPILLQKGEMLLPFPLPDAPLGPVRLRP